MPQIFLRNAFGSEKRYLLKKYCGRPDESLPISDNSYNGIVSSGTLPTGIWAQGTI